MTGTPLAVAENDIAAAEVGQHDRSNVAGMRTRTVGVAILAAEGNGAPGKGFAHRRQQCGRRTDQQIGTQAARAGTNGLGQGQAIGSQAIHLPIARYQRPPACLVHFPILFRTRRSCVA